MLGQGGGILYTPIQVFFGIGFHEAATTSLFLIMITSFSATLVFRSASKIDWPLALVMEIVTVLGSIGGGLASGRFSGDFLSFVFAGVVVLVAIFMIREFHPRPVGSPYKNRIFMWRRTFDEQDYCVNVLIALPVSFIAGLASGLVGVGGGILKVPLMVRILGIPMDIAVGSSAFMVGITAAGGFAGHVASGHWDWKTSLILAAAVFIGGQIGARRALSLDNKKMKKVFGWFLMGLALMMIVRAVW